MSKSQRPCEVSFYHLTRSSLDEALPRLLTKVVASGKKSVLLVGSEQRLDHFSRHLWTFSPGSFLPHGTRRDGFAERQPLYLTDEIQDRPNQPGVLICIDKVQHGNLAGLEKCLDIFDGNEPKEVDEARSRWTSAKQAGLVMTYWQQNERGGWTRAA